MSLDPIVIDFQARGVPDVLRSFETIEQRMARSERAGTAASSRESAARTRNTRTEMSQREREYSKLVKSIERDERRAAQAREREAAKASTAVAREAKRSADAVVREERRAAKEVERLEEWKMRVRIRSSEMAGRLAAQQAREEIAAQERVARSRGHTGRRIGGIVTSSLGGMGSTASQIMGFGGAFAVADAARRQMSAEKAAAQLVNSATIGGRRPAGATISNILGQASAVSKETGVSKTDLIAATQNYVAKSSDFKGGMDNMRFFAKVAQANGASLDDITGAAGMLRAQNPGLSSKDERQMVLDMAEQGKQGAVEISDMARLAGGLGSTRSLYAGSQTDNQRKLLGLAQIARTESESPEEAATGVKDMGLEGLKGKHKKVLESWGVKFDKHGRYQDMQQMIEASLTGSHGNLSTLESVFGQRGLKPFMNVATTYNDAGGGEKGLQAVREKLAPILGAHGSEEQLDKQFDDVMNTPGKKLEKAVNQIEETLMQSLEPALEHFASDTLPKLVPIFEEIIAAGGKFAEWFAENPLRGLGALVLARVGADLVAAGIGEHIKKIIEELLRGGGGGGGGTPPTGGRGGAGNTIATDTLVGAAVEQVRGAGSSFQGAIEGVMSGEDRVAKIRAGIQNGSIGEKELQDQLEQAKKGSSLGTSFSNIVQNTLPGVDTVAQDLGIVGKGRSVFGGADAATRNKEYSANQVVNNNAQQLIIEQQAKHGTEIAKSTAALVQFVSAAKDASKALALIRDPGVRSNAPTGQIGNGGR